MNPSDKDRNMIGNSHRNRGNMMVSAGNLATATQNGLALPGSQYTIDSCSAAHHNKIHSAVNRPGYSGDSFV